MKLSVLFFKKKKSILDFEVRSKDAVFIIRIFLFFLKEKIFIKYIYFKSFFIKKITIPSSFNINEINNINTLKRNSFHYGVIIFFKEKGEIRHAVGRSFLGLPNAFCCAFGEYLERTNCRFPQEDNDFFKFKKIKKFSLGRSSLRLSQMVEPFKWQKIYKKFPKKDEDLELFDACDVYNTTSKSMEMLPLVCIYYGIPQKDFLYHQTSSGSGGGVTSVDAQLSAVYELIERDHFLLYWLSGVQPQKIEKNTLPPLLKLYIERISMVHQLEIEVLNISYDSNTFCCSVAIIDLSKQKIAVGCSAGIDAESVIKKALSEALGEISDCSVLNLVNKPMFDLYRPYEDATLTKGTRKNFYSTTEGVLLFRSLFLCGETISYTYLSDLYAKKYESRKQELDAVIALFKNMSKENGDGYNLYLFEYDSKLLSRMKYFVFKAFVPSFLKLWLNEPLATPVSSRLVRFAVKNGITDFTFSDTNQFPHPLT